MVIVFDVGDAGPAGEEDGGVVTDVQVSQIGQGCPDNADVDAVMANDELPEAGEGWGKDEVDVIEVCDEVFDWR